MILQRLELSDAPAALPDDFMREAVELARRKFRSSSASRAPIFRLRSATRPSTLSTSIARICTTPEGSRKFCSPRSRHWCKCRNGAPSRPSLPSRRCDTASCRCSTRKSCGSRRCRVSSGVPGSRACRLCTSSTKPGAYWYVRKELMDKWELTEEMLHHFAIENMHRYFDEHPMPLAVGSAEEGDNSMVMPQKPDSYNACRLLSDDFTSKLRHLLQGNVVVGVPGRDFFVAVKPENARSGGKHSPPCRRRLPQHGPPPDRPHAPPQRRRRERIRDREMRIREGRGAWYDVECRSPI